MSEITEALKAQEREILQALGWRYESERVGVEKMPQCPKHRLFYPFGGKCFYCLCEEFEAKDSPE